MRDMARKTIASQKNEIAQLEAFLAEQGHPVQQDGEVEVFQRLRGRWYRGDSRAACTAWPQRRSKQNEMGRRADDSHSSRRQSPTRSVMAAS